MVVGDQIGPYFNKASSPLEVAKANAWAMALLIKATLDVVTHVLQYGHVHMTHLLPPLCTGLDVALLQPHQTDIDT